MPSAREAAQLGLVRLSVVLTKKRCCRIHVQMSAGRKQENVFQLLLFRPGYSNVVVANTVLNRNLSVVHKARFGLNARVSITDACFLFLTRHAIIFSVLHSTVAWRTAMHCAVHGMPACFGSRLAARLIACFAVTAYYCTYTLEATSAVRVLTK